MRKKAAILQKLCIFLVVVALIGLYAVKLTGEAASGSSQVVSTSSYGTGSVQLGLASLNEKVVLVGSLTGPMVFICEELGSWNYELRIGENIVGVCWNCLDYYDSVSVRVYGVVREGRMAEGRLAPRWNGTVYWNGSVFWPAVICWNESTIIHPTCYYVEAERVERVRSRWDRFDSDCNGIADSLDEEIDARIAKGEGDEYVNVTVMLESKPTSADLAAFVSAGGNVTAGPWESATYGFGGTIPYERIIIFTQNCPELPLVEKEVIISINPPIPFPLNLTIPLLLNVTWPEIP